MEFFKIDGSKGEGGGQILRSAITLSCVSQIPIRVENIRGGRKVPGLRTQHMTSVKILSEIFGAGVSGLGLGSTCIEFTPGNITETEIHEDVGTAGSISLILQSVILAVSISKKRIRLVIRGGTDVAWSPTINYTKIVLKNALERFGIRYSVDINKRGYFPKGGGEVEVVVEPCRRIAPVSLTKRGTSEANLLCTFSKIGRERIESQCVKIVDELESNGWRVDCEIVEERALDGGASVLLYSQDSNSVAGVDSLWDDKKGDFKRNVSEGFLQNSLGVDQNLADMLVVPASQCSDTSVFRVNRITSHLETNLYVTSKITGCKYGTGRVAGGFEVRIRGGLQSGV